MRKLFPAAGFFVIGLVAPNAKAGVINCDQLPDVCTPIVNLSTGSGGPYIYVHNSLGDFLDPTNPTQINYSYNGPNNVGQPDYLTAGGSLATGILQLTNQLLVINGQEEFRILSRDFYTLNGPGSGAVPITVQFTVNGSAAFPAVDPYQSQYLVGGTSTISVCADTYNSVGVRCGQQGFDQSGFTGFGAYYAGFSGPVTLQATLSWNPQVGTPFGLSLEMDSLVGGEGILDLTDPGTLSFILPDGYSITSEGGFSSLAQTPEPSSAEPLGVVLMLAVFCQRFRRIAKLR